MPRTEGVSSSVERRCILLSPRPTSVARCSLGRRMGLPICSIVIVLPFLFSAIFVILYLRFSLPKRQAPHGFALLVRTSGSAAARLKNGVLDTTLRGDILRMGLTLQGVKGRTHHVVGVGGSERLGNDILYAENLEYRTHRATRDDAGTGAGCAHEHLAGAMSAVNVVVQRTAFAQRHENHVALGRLGCLADGFRH